MQHHHRHRIRITPLGFILSLLVGLALTTPGLAQEPSRDTHDVPQAHNPTLPLTNLSQQAILTAADGDEVDWFGNSVAIDGNIAVIGAIRHNQDHGAVYIFEKPTGGSWANATQLAKLTASDLHIHAYFGSAVLIEGDTIIVGADGKDNYKGAIYVFEKPANGWTDMIETAKFTLSKRQDYDGFGGALALSGNTLVIGADGVDDYKGAAFIFEKPAGGRWANATPITKLTADSAEEFGSTVAISGDTIVIGAPGTEVTDTGYLVRIGTAHIFEKPVGGWANATETAKLVLPDRKERDIFGSSVATNGSTVFIGARGDNQYQGAVYVFQKSAEGSWSDLSPTAKLTASDGESASLNPRGEPGDSGDYFGSAITLSGNRLFVGADGDDQDKSVNGNRGSEDDYGAVYVFDQPANGWTTITETRKLTPAVRGANDRFGEAVVSSGDTLLIGAFETNNGQGVVYIFE